MKRKNNNFRLFKTIIIPLTIIFVSTFFLLLYQIGKQDMLSFSAIYLLFYLVTIILIFAISNKFSIYISSIEDITNEHIQPSKDNVSLTQSLKHVETIAEKISYYDKKLSTREEGFNTIINSIAAIIWIQDKHGIIKTFNQDFCSLVNDKNPKSKYFWNVIRKMELQEFIDKIYKNPQNKVKKISFDDKFYLCSSSFLPRTEEIIFILQDTTEINLIEMMKKDFILNVSHELRTPLTSIKGFLETMEDDLSQENRYYIKVIKRNTDRLIYIVNDLLELTKLEHVKDLELEDLDIGQLLQDTLLLFENKITEKNLAVEFELEEDLPKIFADGFKMEQVLINLIDNAIKYTDAGKIKFKISIEEMMVIQISDTGRGISQKDLPRLFERFYVADKSRSRKLGGTGLGLSIVKHIINLHKGSIYVDSQISKGTTFTIKLPLKKV